MMYSMAPVLVDSQIYDLRFSDEAGWGYPQRMFDGVKHFFFSTFLASP